MGAAANGPGSIDDIALALFEAPEVIGGLDAAEMRGVVTAMLSRRHRGVEIEVTTADLRRAFERLNHLEDEVRAGQDDDLAEYVEQDLMQGLNDGVLAALEPRGSAPAKNAEAGKRAGVAALRYEVRTSIVHGINRRARPVTDLDRFAGLTPYQVRHVSSISEATSTEVLAHAISTAIADGQLPPLKATVLEQGLSPIGEFNRKRLKLRTPDGFREPWLVARGLGWDVMTAYAQGVYAAPILKDHGDAERVERHATQVVMLAADARRVAARQNLDLGVLIIPMTAEWVLPSGETLADAGAQREHVRALVDAFARSASIGPAAIEIHKRPPVEAEVSREDIGDATVRVYSSRYKGWTYAHVDSLDDGRQHWFAIGRDPRPIDTARQVAEYVVARHGVGAVSEALMASLGRDFDRGWSRIEGYRNERASRVTLTNMRMGAALGETLEDVRRQRTRDTDGPSPVTPAPA